MVINDDFTDAWSPLHTATGERVKGGYSPPVRLVVSPEVLLDRRTYWLRDKLTHALLMVDCCLVKSVMIFTSIDLWAVANDEKTILRWDVYGPLPVPTFNPVHE